MHAVHCRPARGIGLYRTAHPRSGIYNRHRGVAVVPASARPRQSPTPGRCVRSGTDKSDPGSAAGQQRHSPSPQHPPPPQQPPGVFVMSLTSSSAFAYADIER